MDELGDGQTIKCQKVTQFELKDFNLISDLKAPQGLFKLINYRLTDGLGKSKYLTAIVYNDVAVKADKGNSTKLIVPTSLVLVSEQPLFKLHAQIFKIMYQRLLFPQIKELIEQANMNLSPTKLPPAQISFEFLLSVLFHHLKLDSSNLCFQLFDNIDSKAG